MKVKTTARDRVITLIETVAGATTEREFSTAYRKAVQLLNKMGKEGERKRYEEEDLRHAAKSNENKGGYSWAG